MGIEIAASSLQERPGSPAQTRCGTRNADNAIQGENEKKPVPVQVRRDSLREGADGPVPVRRSRAASGPDAPARRPFPPPGSPAVGRPSQVGFRVAAQRAETGIAIEDGLAHIAGTEGRPSPAIPVPRRPATAHPARRNRDARQMIEAGIAKAFKLSPVGDLQEIAFAAGRGEAFREEHRLPEEIAFEVRPAGDRHDLLRR